MLIICCVSFPQRNFTLAHGYFGPHLELRLNKEFRFVCKTIYFHAKEMPKHARNSALFAILNCFRLCKQMASNKKATSRICFHENNSLTFALIYFHPPPFPALPSRGRVGNSLPSRPPTSLTLPRPHARPHALPRARSRSALTKAGTL